MEEFRLRSSSEPSRLDKSPRDCVSRYRGARKSSRRVPCWPDRSCCRRHGPDDARCMDVGRAHVASRARVLAIDGLCPDVQASTAGSSSQRSGVCAVRRDLRWRGLAAERLDGRGALAARRAVPGFLGSGSECGEARRGSLDAEDPSTGERRHEHTKTCLAAAERRSEMHAASIARRALGYHPDFTRRVAALPRGGVTESPAHNERTTHDAADEPHCWTARSSR